MTNSLPWKPSPVLSAVVTICFSKRAIDSPWRTVTGITRGYANPKWFLCGTCKSSAMFHWFSQLSTSIWVCLKMSCTPLYPVWFCWSWSLWKMASYHWEYTQHFQTNPFPCAGFHVVHVGWHNGRGNASWKPGIKNHFYLGGKIHDWTCIPATYYVFLFKQKYTEYRTYMTNTVIYLDRHIYIYDPYSDEQLLRTYFGKKNVCSLELEGRS